MPVLQMRRLWDKDGKYLPSGLRGSNWKGGIAARLTPEPKIVLLSNP